MTSVTINIDDDVKKEAEAVFSKLGYNISSAVNAFFRQAIREQAIPFEVNTDSKYDEYFNEYNMKILKESIAQAKAGNIIIKTMAELEAMANE
jgi:DNA-damage-inducible protein J